MNGLFTLTWSNVKSAVVYGLLTLGVVFLLSLAQSVLNAGSIFGLNWKAIVDNAVVATIPTLIVMISLLKNLLTNSKGNFLGAVEVIPDKMVGTKE